MIAYHYTTQACAQSILSDGYIRGATAYVPKREKPIAWFSTATPWEPTASKGIATGPGGPMLRIATFEEMAGFGVVRFGIDVAKLKPWPLIGKLARIDVRMRQSLDRAGRKAGSDPRRWYGALQSVPVIGLTLETYDADSGAWVGIGVLGVSHAETQQAQP